MSNNTTKQNPHESLYVKADIQHTTESREYETEVTEAFMVYPSNGTQPVKFKLERMIELAEQGDQPVFKTLNRNGYPAKNGQYDAGAGIATKFKKAGDVYQLTVYIGEVGKMFDSTKITDKKFYSLDAKILEAIFTVVINDAKVAAARRETEKQKRTTLVLD